MPPVLRLQLLGPFHAELNMGDGPRALPPLPTRPARTLLARLALAHPESLPRARLVADLFPSADAERGAHHLRTTLYYLRRAIPDLLKTGGARVGLESSLTLDTDAAHFEAESAPGAPRAALAEAVRRYRGRFLDPPLEGWADAEARRLHDRYVDALRRLAAISQESGCIDDWRDAAERWAAEEPWEVRAHTALVTAHAALGDPCAAEAQAARSRQVLNEAWGQATDEAFETLARQVKALAAAQPARSPHTPSPSTLSVIAPATAPAAAPAAALSAFARLLGINRTSILLEQDRPEEAWTAFAALLAQAEEAALSPRAARSAGPKRSDADLLRQAGVFSIALRSYETGLDWLHASLRRAESAGDTAGIARSQAHLCFALANLGRYGEAQSTGEAALPLVSRMNEACPETILCCAMARTCLHAQADASQALEWAERGASRAESAGLTEPLSVLLGMEAEIFLAQGQTARALAAIERAEQYAGLAPVVSIDHTAARVWLAAGQAEKARRAARQAAAQARDPSFLGVWAGEILWTAAQVLEQVEGNGAARDARRRAFLRFADDLARIAGPAARRMFARANPAHRALARMVGDGPLRIAWLPEPGAPTGRPLRADELAPVVWERDAPGEPALDSPAGRRVRLERLCRAAVEQGAAATLKALANFLAASPRTIQRDLRALRQAGVNVQTRGGMKRG